jgi:hypothetical protein
MGYEERGHMNMEKFQKEKVNKEEVEHKVWIKFQSWACDRTNFRANLYAPADSCKKK